MYPRILRQIRALVRQGEYVLSVHAENEMADDGLTDQDLETAILNGKIVRRERDLLRHGEALIIIEDVPAWVCNKCGERYHHARVFKRMRQIAARGDQITEHLRVPVARYQPGDEAA